jgi:hypothetical protein
MCFLVPIRCTFELEVARLQAQHRICILMWGNGRILLSCSAIRVVVKERHSFFLINHVQIKENIFWLCSLGIISTYKVDSYIQIKSPNFYVTSGIRDWGLKNASVVL